MKVLAWPAFKTRYKNPYNWLLYAPMEKLGVEVEEFTPQKLLTGRYDVIHLHWPVETIVRHPNPWVAAARVGAFLSLLNLARWRGDRIIWTIHDEQPHVLLHSRLGHQCEHWLGKCTDAVINLCEASQWAIYKRMPQLQNKPGFVIPHGHYREAYPNQTTAAAARERLHLPPGQPTLLYLGYISPYKNVPQLINTFRQLPQENISLVIAGKPDHPALKEAILQAAADDPRVHLHLRFIPEGELQFFFNAADWVVLPFESILNSGSALLALSFDRPVLVPHLGAMPEWQQRLGQDWVKTYTGELGTEVLTATLDAIAHRPQTPAPLADLDWRTISQKTVEVYRKVVS
ncbi:MAG TPA: glycosyltransferase [Trichocoleus sp.]